MERTVCYSSPFLKCLFVCSCNSIPLLCKWISLLRLLWVCLFFCEMVKTKKNARHQQTSYLMMHLQNQFIHLWKSAVFRGIVWRECERSNTSIKAYFVILCILLPPLKCELMEQQKRTESRSQRKVLDCWFVSGEAESIFFVTDPISFLHDKLSENFLSYQSISLTGIYSI